MGHDIFVGRPQREQLRHLTLPFHGVAADDAYAWRFVMYQHVVGIGVDDAFFLR